MEPAGARSDTNLPYMHKMRRFSLLLITMLATQIYAALVGFVIVAPFILAILFVCYDGIIRGVGMVEFCYQLIFRRSSTTPSFTETIVIFTLFGTNALYLSKGFHPETLTQRSGRLAVINLSLLAFGHHMSYLSNRVRITGTAYSKIHHWAAVIVVIEGSAHSIVALKSSVKMSSGLQIAKWTVCQTITLYKLMLKVN